jgi:type IV pilus assembly protein PilE
MYQNASPFEMVSRSRRLAARGFTLVELMIVVAIIGILAAVALPSYRDYILRGQLVDATNLLSSTQANMERYFQDNRTYRTVSAAIVAPCADATPAGIASRTTHNFFITCVINTAPAVEGYVLTATGSGSVLNFVYTIDQTGSQTTVTVGGPGWTVPAAPNNNCWIVKKGQTCG